MLLSLAFISSITICLIAIPMIVASHDKHEDTPYYSLIAICLTTTLYQWFSWQFHEASNITTAVELLKYQSAALIITAPCIFYCFAKWTEFKKINTWLYIQIAIAAVLLIINAFSNFGIRYSQLEQSSVELIYSEFSTDSFIGVRSIFGYFFLAYGITLIFWIGSRVNFFVKQQQRIYAYSLSIFILFLISSAIWSLINSNGNTAYVSLIGFPLTLLMLILAVNIAHKVKIKSEELFLQQSRQIPIEQAMTCLAQGVSNADNLSFYDEVAINIQNLYKTKYAFIGVCHYEDGETKIKTISVVKNGKVIDNFEYLLAGTPCNDVIGKQVCTYPNHVDELFPKDVMLKEMSIKSYVGLPLFSADKDPVGIVVLLENEEYKIDDNLLKILHVFGARIGAELSRDRLDNKLKHMAYVDQTTKLPNRTRLFDEISRHFQTGFTNNNNVILMLIDIDRFKDVNRVYGYDVAEEILKTVGERLKTYGNKDIFIARNYGGEFAVLISNINNDGSHLTQIHWQAVSDLIKSPIHINNKEIKLECSAGAVVFPHQVSEQPSILRCAESALQQAKYAGRNQCALFDANLQAIFDRKQELQKLLREALDNEEGLFLVYQPQTDHDGKLVGAEALIRWIHPEKGFISPAEFIPMVEETELIHVVGYWVIRKVLSQIQAWQQTNHTVPDHISINVAAKQLTNLNFTKSLLKACSEFDVNPSQIVLELTESGLLSDVDYAIEILKQLQTHGFKIALDDFGTGYSSLSYLKKMPIDILKIDKSFVDDIAILSTKQLMQSVFSIAEHLHFEIIAEGTETLDQVDELVKIGCDCFQGYYFSKPLEPELFINWEYDKNNPT